MLEFGLIYVGIGILCVIALCAADKNWYRLDILVSTVIAWPVVAVLAFIAACGGIGLQIGLILRKKK
jgi:hypothetical protein